jgi:methylation protein EvaC
MKKKFLNLGMHPIANSFLKKGKKNNFKSEFFYNLSVGFNEKNYLVSLMLPVNPKKQYTDTYAHRASESKTMRLAFNSVAKKLQKRFRPNLSMEIGSNDGVFIRNFSKKKIIAVEPCKNLARITKKNKFKTYPDFWNKKLSKKILKENGKIDLIFSANTISHIPNLKETFDAISMILTERGTMIIEDPYLPIVIKSNSYDQFYDEHVYVFSALAIRNIVKQSNLRLFDIEPSDTHGGSMKYFICKKNNKKKNTKRLTKYLSKEINLGLHKFYTYKKFAQRVQKSKKDLLNLLKNLKKKNKKIISYGATYKSTTVFNYCKIGTKYLDYVVDTTLNKQGKFTPGQHIPIISPEQGFNDDVDYAFLGAWNFKKEIIKKEKNFIKNGGKFITHVPNVKVITKY